MFLHMSVILFTGRGGVCRSRGCILYTPWTPPPPVEMAIEAGSTHPTGMHSCLIFDSPLSIRLQVSLQIQVHYRQIH